MQTWLFIAAGGAVGTVARYAVHTGLQRAGGAFPLGTLVINVVGCLLIGIVAGLIAGGHALREEHRLGITVGLLGGFTTFSTFGIETLALAQVGQLRLALLNVLLSNTVGLAAVWLGYRVANWSAV